MKIPVKTGQEQEKTKDEIVKTEGQVQEQEPLTAEEAAAETTVAQDNVSEAEEERVEAETEEVPEEQEMAKEVAKEDELTQITQQLQLKEQELQEQYDARLRLQAEFENFKKRKEKENTEFRKYANDNLIQDILPILDDFERAIAAAEQTHKLEDFLQGIELIFSKFVDVLKKRGIKEIEAEGKPFNPEFHEAVTQIETNEVEEGTIMHVLQKGYTLHDRVLRAPKVAVAKNVDAEDTTNPTA